MLLTLSKEFLVVFTLFLVLLVFILCSVAMLTVTERKFLAAMQRRRGPNVVGIWGSLQAFADALKLLNKQFIFPALADRIWFYAAPCFVLLSAFLGWFFIPVSNDFGLFDTNLSLFFLLGMSSLGAIGILLTGWAGHSRYSVLGGLRAAAQLVSYEVVFGFLFFPFVLQTNSADLLELVAFQNNTGVWNMFASPFLFIIFLTVILAETNRAPFDLPEAESELVAGFNVEYSSSGFVALFLAEYSSMMLMSALGALVFLGGFGPENSAYVFGFKVVCFCLFIVGARGLLPRYRYDQLMQLNWGRFLAVVTAYSWLVLIFYVASPIDFFERAFILNEHLEHPWVVAIIQEHFNEFLDPTIGLEYNRFMDTFGSRYYVEDVELWLKTHFGLEIDLATAFNKCWG